MMTGAGSVLGLILVAQLAHAEDVQSIQDVQVPQKEQAEVQSRTPAQVQDKKESTEQKANDDRYEKVERRMMLKY
jgi:hypothetical protein